MPIKSDTSHGVSLPLIIYSIATTTAKYELAIEPLLSLSLDFYARVFIYVKRVLQRVKTLRINLLLCTTATVSLELGERLSSMALNRRQRGGRGASGVDLGSILGGQCGGGSCMRRGL